MPLRIQNAKLNIIPGFALSGGVGCLAAQKCSTVIENIVAIADLFSITRTVLGLEVMGTS